MRTVTLKQLDYENYEIIYRSIMEIMPFALVNQGYNKRLKMGFFNFWDSDYIPPQLEKYIMRPPFHEDNVKKLDSLITNTIQGSQRIPPQISDREQVIINEKIIDKLVGKLKEFKVPEEELAELFKLSPDDVVQFKPAPEPKISITAIHSGDPEIKKERAITCGHCNIQSSIVSKIKHKNDCEYFFPDGRPKNMKIDGFDKVTEDKPQGIIFEPAPDIESEPCPNCNKYTQKVDTKGVIHCQHCLAKSTDEKYPVDKELPCPNCKKYIPKVVTQGIIHCPNCNYADPEENPNINFKGEIRCNHCKMIGYGKEPIHKDDCNMFNPDGTQKDARTDKLLWKKLSTPCPECYKITLIHQLQGGITRCQSCNYELDPMGKK